MIFKDQKEEDDYRRSLMAMICLGDPSRTLCIVPSNDAIPKFSDLDEKKQEPTKKDLNYYEKKLNEFPKIDL